MNSKLLTITYLFYIVFWESFVLGGAVYLVFWKGGSEWLLLLGVLMSSAAYSPKSWRKLVGKKI